MMVSRSMRLIALVVVIAALLAVGCRNDPIINGTPVEDDDILSAEETADIPAAEEDSQENGGSDPRIDQVIVNISDQSEDNDSITDVLIDDEDAADNKIPNEEDLEGYFGRLSVSFLDVGCGDSIFVMTPMNGTMILDGGDNGLKAIKHMREYGIFYYLDVMISTNPAQPYVGGLDSILFNMFQVAEIYDNGQKEDTQSYNYFFQLAKGRGMFIVPQKDVPAVKIGKEPYVDVSLIIPYKDGYSDNPKDNSIVVKMVYNQVSFLFMSDCTSACEEKLKGYNLKADVLKIGNFGSSHATSDEFLDNVMPKTVIISAEAGECSPGLSDTVKKLEARGIEVYRTDVHGNIIVESKDGRTYSVKTEFSSSDSD